MNFMTRPNLGPDKTYEEQRKARLQDCIDDYLQDPKVSPKQVYEEMLSCIDDVIRYHKNSLDRTEELRSLMHGYRPNSDQDLVSQIRSQIPDRY